MAGMSDQQMVQALFGGIPGAPPTAGMSLLGMGLGGPGRGNLFSLLNPLAQPGGLTLLPGATAGVPTASLPQQQPQLSAMDRAMLAGDTLNHNAYGTTDPTHLGILGSAGFPLFNDPRMLQGFLGIMAQNGDQDAMDQLRRLLGSGFNFGSLLNAFGGGVGGMGGNVGGGQSAAGAHETGTTSMDAELAAGAAGGGGMGGGGVGDVNAGMGGLY